MQKSGMEYFIVEQEEYPGTTPIKAAKDDAEYMKASGFNSNHSEKTLRTFFKN